jgi:DNA-binding YbaB/EbfC family protein
LFTGVFFPERGHGAAFRALDSGRVVQRGPANGSADMLRGLGDLKDMGGMLNRLMNIKNEMEAIKEQLGQVRVDGEAGAGMVRVLMNGKFEVLEVKIDPSVIDANDPAVLETLVQAAVNTAIGKAQDVMKEKMQEITGGLNIPGLNL